MTETIRPRGIPSNRVLDPTWQAGPGPDVVPVVLDDSRRHDLPTGRVTVTAPEGFTDKDLAHVAGFTKYHHGVDVTRYDDGTALVSLWND